jgi:hypothetical protein
VDAPGEGGNKLDSTRFAHPAEREFAKLLDFYQIAWEYEPRSFPLRWAEDGRIVEQFTPDFYLPAEGMYIELTAMRQRLVTRKNRKIRKLRELYPDVRVKLLCHRDLMQMTAKYHFEW